MIKIDINNVIASAPAAQTAKNYVGSAKNGVANVRWQIDGRVRSRSNIDARLNKVHYSLSHIETKIGEIRNFADFAANRYWQNEYYIRMCAMQLRSVRGLAGRNAFWPIELARNYLIYLYNKIFGRRGYIGHLVSDFAGLAARWVSGYNKAKLQVNSGAVNIANAGIGLLNGLVKWQNKLAATAANTYTGAKSFIDASISDANRFVAKWQKEIKAAGTALVLGPVTMIYGGVISIILLAIWLSKLFGTNKPDNNKTKKPDEGTEKKEEQPKPEEKIVAPLVGQEPEYSDTVKAGTVRRVIQQFGWWDEETQAWIIGDNRAYVASVWGEYDRVSHTACGVAATSMALSWLGIDKTPIEICNLNVANGNGNSGDSMSCWDQLGPGVRHERLATPGSNEDLETAYARFQQEPNKYSPPVVYTKGGSHFVVIIGEEDGYYMTQDPGFLETQRIPKSDTNYTQVDQFIKE